MKILQIIITALLFSIAVTGTLRAAPPVSEIMEKMDELDELNTDITVKGRITHQAPKQGIKVLEGVYYRRDRDDTFLLVLTAPDNEKGNGYLRAAGNTWIYRRNTRTFQLVGRSQDIGGTNTKTEDIEKTKFTDLYEPARDEQGNEIISEETLGKANIPVYRFEVKAKVKDVDYPKEVYWVRQDNLLTMKVEEYSLSGTLMETTYYPEYTEIQGSYLCLREITVDHFEKSKTIFELSGISLEPIDDAVFTKAYLENLSK